MQKNSSRKGLALGAAFAMFASLFVGAAPASANTDGQYIAATPAAGPVANFNGLLNEDFEMKSYLLPGVTNTEFADNKVIYEVTKTSGAMEVLITSASVSHGIADLASPTSISYTAVSTGSNKNYIEASSSRAVTVSGGVDSTTKVSFFNVRAYTASGVVSSSPVVTLQVKVWIENPATTNGVHDTLEWYTTKTVTLHSTNAVPASTSIGSPATGDTVLTVSATVGALNFQNLSGGFFLQVQSTNNHLVGGNPAVTVSPAISGQTIADRAGVVSMSFAVSGSNGVTAGTSVSAHVRYAASGNTADSGFRLGSLTSAVMVANALDSLKLSVVESDHSKGTTESVTVRPNQTYTVRVHASSNSVSLSGVAVTIKFAGSEGLVTGSKTVSINGGAELTSYPESVTVTTGTNGYASWTMKTTGFAVTNAIKVQANVGNVRATQLTMTATAPVFSIINDYSEYITAPGAAVNISYAVEDQWEVASTRTDLRIKVTRGGTGFAYAETVSYVAVSGGKATFAFTPSPATKTGSATVESALQRLNTDSNVWEAEANTVAAAKVNVKVTGVVSTFSALSKVSQSASVSYFPSTVSYKTVTATVTNAGESVSVTGPAALIFRESGKTATASGAITLRANSSGVVSVDVASLLEGSHTITFKVGSESTTSLLVVDPAAGNVGVKIAFDKSSMNTGETAVFTGKVTDMNGNPVDTTNTDGSGANLVVSYTGKGLPFNTGTSVETDEKGEFKVNVLALAGDAGTGVITATYRPAGAAVDTKNVTVAQTITIVAPAAPAAPEVNAVIGTFNGRVAVRVENAKGSVVSVKIGGSWFKYTSLNDNYLFSRKSVKGRTVAVAVYVNGTLENVATITVK